MALSKKPVNGMKDILPQEIENLAIEIAQIEEELGDATLYTQNPQRFDELTSTLSAKQKLKEDKENQWLEIQLKKEELESAAG